MYTLRYVTPNGEDGQPMVKPGQKVEAGQEVGRVQDRAKLDPQMTNHIHVEIQTRDGKFVDPEKEIGARRRQK